MYALNSNSDYSNAYKAELVQYLKSSLRKEVSGNQDFEDIFEQLDIVEKLVEQINKDFNKIQEKYKLLFGLRDFARLFKEEDFKNEILLYIKYKGLDK
jgi:uncharacterized protein YicC (UPF0701 family)